MANYKIALKLHQSQAGDENARVNISIDNITVGDNVEVPSTDSENPTLLVYDVADLPSPAADATITVKVELLNDHYVDESNDRNVYWVGAGNACQQSDGNYYRAGVFHELITDWTDVNSFSWASACEYTGDQNGTIDMSESDDGVQLKGWWPFRITATYVSATVPLTNLLVDSTD